MADVQRWLASYSRLLLNPQRIAVLEACLIGAVCGLAGVCLKQGAGGLGGWRVFLSARGPAWLWLPLIGAVGGWLAGWMIERWSPAAAGSGIPHVKLALARGASELTWRVGVVKLLSTMLVLGAGIPLGRQGPTVQVGAAIAGQLSRWLPTSPDHRRQLIAAGAAAGLAAGFNAPIAGVLFVVEELLQDLSGLTLGTAIIASFIGAVVSRLLGGQGLNFSSSFRVDAAGISLEEIPLLILLGAVAGGLGGLFSQGILASAQFYQRSVRWRLAGRIALAGGISGLVIGLLPEPFHNNSGLQEILLSGELDWRLIAIAFGAQFLLTLVAYGAGTPGGIFAPSLLLGSAVGKLLLTALLGLTLLPFWPSAWQLPVTSTSTYVLTGMGAFFSAVTKGPMTAIVILFEMTSDFKLVLPLMISCVVAYGISNSICRGSIYTRLLALNGIDLQSRPSSTAVWETITAAQVMQRQVETLDANLQLEQARQIFKTSHHRGFPVVEDGKLVGILSQTDLANLVDSDADLSLWDIMTPNPVTVTPESTLGLVLHLLNRHQISRLPVTEGQRLVGIITRADIIRAESRQIEQDAPHCLIVNVPSYTVYQTRAPNTGKGRLLVPIANPHSAPTLLQMAAAIARDRDYEIECLHIIAISRSRSPAQTAVRTEHSRRLLKKALRLGQDWNIPIHTQIRVTHSIPQAIIDTIQERHIDLTLMGWRGATNRSGSIFNDTLDTLIRQAPGELMLVKLGSSADRPSSQRYPSLFARLHLNRWLVPTAGGPNAQVALRWLPALISLSSTPEIRLCQVLLPDVPNPSPRVLLQSQAFLEERLTCPIVAKPIFADSVTDAILSTAEQTDCDVIVIGASGDSLLQQAVRGNIPEAIARRSRCTVVLVRGKL